MPAETNKKIRSFILIIGSAINAVLIFYGFWIFLHNNTFIICPLKYLEYFALGSPLITAILGYFTHRLDKKHNGGGIAHRFKEIKSRLNDNEHSFCSGASVVSASMTKQSVLAAVAAGILVVIIQSMQPDAISKIYKVNYNKLTAFASAVCLSFALLCNLVSLVCYDYSIRFNWKDDNLKINLVRKALHFDISSFYLLSFGIIFAALFFNILLGLILNYFYALFLLRYYFFFEKKG
jgi:hypothetical protein